jgi:L-ribulose-5-phosphate 4-epimerase
LNRDKYNHLFSEIIQTCLELEKIGYFVGTWGNVSVRVDEGCIVTPSKIAYNAITNDDFVILAPDGSIVSGHRIPTSEADIHRLLYTQKKDVGAIIHNHSPYATAVSCLNMPIEPFVEDLAQIAGGRVNCTRYVNAGQHMKLAQEVIDTIGEANAVLVANHGIVGCGRTLAEAFCTCQIVEKAALIMLTAGTCGTLRPIPDEFVKSERHRYLYKYGTKEDRQ